MKLERVSKPYWTSKNKESLAIIIPKIIREAADIDSESYIKWSVSFDNNEVNVSFKKLD